MSPHTGHTQAGLPLRGRPSQDKVRSVTTLDRTDIDSRDHSPPRASSRWTACWTLGSVTAGQSLRCLCQVIGKSYPKTWERLQTIPAQRWLNHMN